jgi:hypothetical protein
MSEEKSTIFDDTSLDTEEITGIEPLDKVLGIVLGSVGMSVVGAITVAAIMNPGRIGKNLNRITGPGVRRGYAAINMVWQIIESFARNNAKQMNPEKAKKMERIFNAIDQGLDLIGILLNKADLAALFSRERDY